jgi:hypothetical protein
VLCDIACYELMNVNMLDDVLPGKASWETDTWCGLDGL